MRTGRPDVATVTFFMRGPENLLTQVAEMPRNQPFSMQGYIRFGQRQFNLSSVDLVAATPSPAVTPTPAGEGTPRP